MFAESTPTGAWRGLPWWEINPKKLPSDPCPTCCRPMASYQRPITNTMCLKLIHLSRLLRHQGASAYCHVEKFDRFGGKGEFGTLSKWALVEMPPKADQKKKSRGGRTLGLWRLTEFGTSFVNGDVKVPSHVLVKWGSQLLGFAGRMVSIQECLKPSNTFSYKELMSAEMEKYQQLTLDRIFSQKGKAV